MLSLRNRIPGSSTTSALSRLLQLSTHIFRTSPSNSYPVATMSTSVPQTMSAVVASKVGGPEVLSFSTSQPVPTLKPSDVLVKNHLAGINYIDTYFRSGTYPSPKPEILGREAVGTVAQIGDSVPSSYGFKPGDRVVWTSATGGYAEYTAVPAIKVVKIPESLSQITDESAAGGFLMGLTALSLLTEAHSVQKGETILIHAAAGGTGKLMVQVAKAKGAKVVGTAGGAEKCKLAKENGADEVVDYSQGGTEEWVKKVLGLTNGEGVDAVFDGVGKATWDGSLDVVKRKGTVAFFGAASGPVPDIPVNRLRTKNSKVCRPTMDLYTHTREELEFYANMFFEHLGSGKMKINIHKLYPLEEAKQAHIDLEGRKTSGKLLLKI